MKFLEKSDKEIKEIAQPIWDNLIKTSNMKDYGGFTKDFSLQYYINKKATLCLENFSDV